MSPAKKGRKIRSNSGKKIPSELKDNRLGASRFASAISSALHLEYDDTHAAVKTIGALIGANERAVKNWLDGRNGPSGELLISLCRHSEQVLETVLALAGRSDLITAKKLVDAKAKLHEMLALIDKLEEP